MNWQGKFEISQNVFWVGVRDWNRKLFDALIPLPRGTTYNAYLIIGQNKKALIDTVNPGFESQLEERITQITNPADLDYIVMNHAEPDHAGSIPHMMNLNQKAKLITSTKGAKIAQIFYKVPENRIQAVADGESIDLGGKTMKFIEAPMLHWPETMFTYVPENKTLFPCDFFGSHVAEGLYDDEVEDLMVLAQRYYGEIMMPFRVMAQKALDKIKSYQIEIIAPSHGPIHKNTERILASYRKWSNGETRKKAIIAYVTMWKSTEKMIQPIVETLSSEGIETVTYNLAFSDIGDIAKDLVDSRALILGTPTVLSGAHPLAVYATYLIKALKPPTQYGVVLSSYGWGGGAIRHVQEVLGPTKMEILGTMETNGPPTEDNIRQIVELGKTLAKKIRGHTN